jgi:hypothetical protein
MPRQTKNSAAKSNGTLEISVFPEFPGAVFVGTLRDADVEYAAFWQGIRQSCESESEAGRWHLLSEIGLDYDRIEAAVRDPAILTNCIYGMPGPAMSAAMSAAMRVVMA